MTQGDRFRFYSDEALAELFNQIETEGRAYGPRGKAAWLRMLQSVVDDAEDHDEKLRKQFWADWNDNKYHGEGGGGG